MRHLILTCKQHPRLRWSCKSIGFTVGEGYNGLRHIFYTGSNPPAEHECSCPPEDLILAPEDEWSGLGEDELKAKLREDLC